MIEALRLFRAIEVWIYLLLGLGALFFIRKFILAWQELRDSGFGLERESAQVRLNQAAGFLVLLLAMAISEFVLVSFIAPAVPGAIPLPTPTLDLLASPTTTLLPTTPQPGQPNAATPTGAQTPQAAAGGCLPGQVEITSPANGGEVNEVVEIQGSANIPNFGFYKLEMKRVEETSWLTILAGNEIIVNGTLGSWNTSLLPPGDLQLSLVLTDNQGQVLEPCIVQVRVTNIALTPQP
jgi:hypothetical protein